MVIHEQGDGLVRMLKNPNLSMKTKGLLAYLSRCPEFVPISYPYIAEDMSDGIAAIRAAAHEAEREGYLRREQRMTVGKDGGRFGEAVWYVRI